jgi:putative inorganic carbon (HCO3(-)) transporter
MTALRGWVDPGSGSSVRAVLLTVGFGLLVGLGLALRPGLGAVALGGGLLALAALRWPPLLVALMFTGILFDRIGLTGVKLADFPVTASKLTVLGSLGLWVLHAALYRTSPVRGHRVLTTMAVVVLSTGLSIAWSGTMKVGKFTLFGLGMMTVLVGLVYAVLTERSLQPLLRIFGLVFSVVLAFALLGGGGGSGEAARASGTMGDPNEWAAMVLLVVPFLLGGLARDPHPLIRPLRMGLFLMTPLAVLQSESRSALLVFALVLPGLLFLLRERRGELGLCAAAGVVAAPLVVDLSTAFARFERLLRVLGGDHLGQDGSISERTELLRQGRELFLEHWLLGAGPGNFSRATGFIGENGKLRPAHNTYLEVASEQGVVGLVPFAVCMVTVAVTLITAYRRAPTLEDRSRVGGAIVGLAAFALMAATLGLLTFSMAYLLLGLALAFVTQAERAPGAASP